MLEAILSFLPRAIAQGTPLLYGATGEIITQKFTKIHAIQSFLITIWTQNSAILKKLTEQMPALF